MVTGKEFLEVFQVDDQGLCCQYNLALTAAVVSDDQSIIITTDTESLAPMQANVPPAVVYIVTYILFRNSAIAVRIKFSTRLLFTEL